MNKRIKITRIFAPILIIAAGFVILISLTASRKKPQKMDIQNPGALVKVIETHYEDRTIRLEGTGTVKPRNEIEIMAQVSGKLEWVSSDLESGGIFEKGDVLVRIEQVDYTLAVQQAKASFAQADYALKLAQANAESAEREWKMVMKSQNKLLGTDGMAQKPDPLVLKQPQLLQAQAAYESAQAVLKMTELNLARTEIRAPFNCRVKTENAAMGKLVNPNIPVAVVYGTDVFEIEVGMPIGDLTKLDIPGAQAIVKLNTGSRSYTWEGIIDRGTGVIDRAGRLAMVVVRIIDPLENSKSDKLKLLSGSFVHVDIAGKTIDHIIPLPRVAVRTGNQVWVALPDSTLDIRDISAAHFTSDEVLISDGIEEGELIVLTNLSGAAQGMKLRPIDREAAGE